jgi:hypothetical protein
MIRALLPMWPTVAVGIGLYILRNAWVSILLYHAGTLLAAWVTPGSWGKLRKGFDPWWAASAILVGLITFGAIRLLLPSLTGVEAQDLWGGFRERLASLGLAGGGLIVFVAYFVTVHPVLEDLAWRGVLEFQEEGLAYLPKRNDLWFALYHVPVLLCIFPDGWGLATLSFFVLVISSMSWREIAKRTGGLQSIVMQHAAADAAILAAVLWP